MTHGHEKSDSVIVAVKPANKAGANAAEPVEPRTETKGNAGQQSTCRAQYRVSVTQALERIRQVCRHSPEVGAVCGKAAVRICAGGREVTRVPIATRRTARRINLITAEAPASAAETAAATRRKLVRAIHARADASTVCCRPSYFVSAVNTPSQSEAGGTCSSFRIRSA